MPSCPIFEVNEDSPELGLVPMPCGDLFPEGDTCPEINFSFNNVKDTIGNVTITYKYQGDNCGLYTLYAGTFQFPESNDSGNSMCTEQETAVTVIPDDFNGSRVVMDEVLNVKII